MHIQHEWYYLFAYIILRSIPNKLGGVMVLGSSIMIFLIIPFINKMKMKSENFYSINKIMFWIFICVIFMLAWLEAKPVEDPFILISQIITMIKMNSTSIINLHLLIWKRDAFHR